MFTPINKEKYEGYSTALTLNKENYYNNDTNLCDVVWNCYFGDRFTVLIVSYFR